MFSLLRIYIYFFCCTLHIYLRLVCFLCCVYVFLFVYFIFLGVSHHRSCYLNSAHTPFHPLVNKSFKSQKISKTACNSRIHNEIQMRPLFLDIGIDNIVLL